MAVHQLQHLPLGNDIRRIRQHPHDAHVVDRHHHLESTRIEEVSDQHTGRIAEHRVGGLAPAPQIGTINDIVMEQGGRVDELDHRSEFVMMRPTVSHGAGRQQDQSRAQPLAPALHDVLGHLADQDHLGMEALADHRVNGGHVRPDQPVQLLHSHNTAPSHKTLES
ncbi:MAG TPA: hypothetical protein PL117_11400 [Accumulibacter sp.]|uniref:hypothetical protein n=1 Tax=Accumulibacter sp. TaxID=2053492 RepID=UPI002C26B364|nr:hypothetical protein [Accumulibacter sp.]HRF73371.1 hypothetical protein [Accumulibacter sp.]